MQSSTLSVARRYVDAMSAGDNAAVMSLFAEDIVWHQPGNNRLSGTYRGAAAVGELLGATMAISEGTFELTVTGDPMVNDALFAIRVHFSARRSAAKLAMDGVDVLRIDNGKIAEVWLFSDVQQEEDAFWDAD